MLDLEAVWDIRQGIPAADQSAADVSFEEITSWFDDGSLDGPCSLAHVAENIDLEPAWILRKVNEWRARRAQGSTERLVPPQHER